MGYWVRGNFFLFFFGVFALVGTILGLVGANSFLHRTKLTNSGIHTTGTVVEMVGDHDGTAPVVAFYLRDGSRHTYQSSVYSSPPAYQSGESVELWYNPDNPDELTLSGLDSWLVPAICGLFFLIFGGVGYGGLFYQIFKKRDINWLKQNGEAVQATFSGVYVNYSIKVNGTSPWVIQAQWHDSLLTNKDYTFDSEAIWHDPTQYVEGKTLTVLIDPKNPGLYYMDVSFLPENGN